MNNLFTRFTAVVLMACLVSEPALSAVHPFLVPAAPQVPNSVRSAMFQDQAVVAPLLHVVHTPYRVSRAFVLRIEGAYRATHFYRQVQFFGGWKNALRHRWQYALRDWQNVITGRFGYLEPVPTLSPTTPPVPAARGSEEPIPRFSFAMLGIFKRHLGSGSGGSRPTIHIEGGPAFQRSVERELAKSKLRKHVHELGLQGVRTIRVRTAETFNYILHRETGVLEIDLEEENAEILSIPLVGSLRAYGKDVGLAGIYYPFPWEGSGALGYQDIHSSHQPIYEGELVQTYLYSFLHGKLEEALAVVRGHPVDSKDILSLRFEEIQFGQFQVVVKIRVWVAWQAEPIEMAALVSGHFPGMEVLTIRNEQVMPDKVVRDEATHFAEFHRYSPELYAAPLASGYGIDPRGWGGDVFITLMPFRPGFEINPILYPGAEGKVHRKYVAMAARYVKGLAPGKTHVLPVPVAGEYFEAIDRAGVAATTKHWARTFTATGEGLIDPRLTLSAGDNNFQATLGPEEMTLPDPIKIWRTAARGREALPLEDLLDYLTAPLHTGPMETPASDPSRHPFVYYAGDPDDLARRDELIFEGVLQGLEESGLSPDARRVIEIRLWSAYVQTHAVAVDVAIGRFYQEANEAAGRPLSALEPSLTPPSWLSFRNLEYQQALTRVRDASPSDQSNQREQEAVYLRKRLEHHRLRNLANRRLASLGGIFPRGNARSRLGFDSLFAGESGDETFRMEGSLSADSFAERELGELFIKQAAFYGFTHPILISTDEPKKTRKLIGVRLVPGTEWNVVPDELLVYRHFIETLTQVYRAERQSSSTLSQTRALINSLLEIEKARVDRAGPYLDHAEKNLGQLDGRTFQAHKHAMAGQSYLELGYRQEWGLLPFHMLLTAIARFIWFSYVVRSPDYVDERIDKAHFPGWVADQVDIAMDAFPWILRGTVEKTLVKKILRLDRDINPLGVPPLRSALNPKRHSAVSDTLFADESGAETMFAGEVSSRRALTLSLPKIPSEGTAGEELISALGLEQAHVIEEPRHDTSTGITIYRIQIPRRWKPWRPPEGLQILRNELGVTRLFDLLFDPDGSLNAIVPILTDRTRVSWASYLDLTAYSFTLPSPSDPKAADRWSEIAIARLRKLERTQRIIDRYPGGILPFNQEKPYTLAVMVPEIHYPFMIAFDPTEWLLPDRRDQLTYLLQRQPESPRIFMPVYPTVYPPAAENNRSKDTLYLQQIAPSAFPLRQRPAPHILVVGPGTGIDTWLAWLVAGPPTAMHAVGINPLEVANVRALARIAGFSVDARLHDNILNARGQSIFGKIRFDRIYSNAPFFRTGPRRTQRYKPLRSYWDGDQGDFIEGLTQGMGQTLLPGKEGEGLLWYENTHPTLGQIFKAAGLQGRLIADDDDDVEIYRIQRLPKASPRFVNAYLPAWGLALAVVMAAWVFPETLAKLILIAMAARQAVPWLIGAAVGWGLLYLRSLLPSGHKPILNVLFTAA